MFTVAAYQQTVNKIPPLIGPFKRIYKDYKGFFPHFSEKNRALKDRFLAVFRGGEGFRKVREAYRKRFHLSWYL